MKWTFWQMILALVVVANFLFSGVIIAVTFGTAPAGDCLTTYAEGIGMTLLDQAAEQVSVQYKLTTDDTYQTVDPNLIRQIDGMHTRIDLIGLTAGQYDLIVTKSNGAVIKNHGVKVTAIDRSGYAFFQHHDGVGAYQLDGRLKSNAQVIYVTDTNKNTVECNGVAGLNAILNHPWAQPLVVRIMGRINADTKTQSGEYQGRYAQINGLLDYVTDHDGTCFNLLEVCQAQNVTIEGIGPGAELFQWGFNFKRCQSIEVRNLTFTDYPIDACAIEGDPDDVTRCARFFIHHNQFNRGKNWFNDTPEHDMFAGDGATDIKNVSDCSIAYNHYHHCKKTILISGSSGTGQPYSTRNVTFHHNYFDHCYNRLPRASNTNLHFYNNLFVNSEDSCAKLGFGSYLFSECNYFESCNAPMKFASDGEVGSAAMKSYHDVFDNCRNKKWYVVVQDRTAMVPNQCPFGNNFDMDSTVFYYDDATQSTKVAYLTAATQARKDVLKFAGPIKANPF